MMANHLPKDRIYISNAADATPRSQGSIVCGRSMLGVVIQVASAGSARVDFSVLAIGTPSPSTVSMLTVLYKSRKQYDWNFFCRVIARQAWAAGSHVHDRIFHPTVSYHSNSPLPALSNPSMDVPEQFEDAAESQDNIRVEASHVITSLSYGAQSLLRDLPTHPPSFARLSRNAPQLTICHHASICALSRFDPS